MVLEVISRWRISGQGGKCCIFGRGEMSTETKSVRSIKSLFAWLPSRGIEFLTLTPDIVAEI